MIYIKIKSWYKDGYLLIIEHVREILQNFK